MLSGLSYLASFWVNARNARLSYLWLRDFDGVQRNGKSPALQKGLVSCMFGESIDVTFIIWTFHDQMYIELLALPMLVETVDHAPNVYFLDTSLLPIPNSEPGNQL